MGTTRRAVYAGKSAPVLCDAHGGEGAMTKQEHLLAIAEEECAELAQRLSKALRFGLLEVQPVATGGDGVTDNLKRIRAEYTDLVALMEMLDILPPYTDEKDRKKAKVIKFLAYSRECGTLVDPSSLSPRPPTGKE